MERPVPGTWRVHSARWLPRDGMLGLFRRTPRPARTGRKPSRAERRAAARTAQAEANLTRTEHRIHQLADEVRRDLKGSA